MTSPLRVAALAAVLFGGLLVLAGVLGPATSTETRYMESGREMLATGDWVIPRLNSAPLLEKPPFHYWVTAASIAAFGLNDVAPHVPSLLAGALALLVVAAIARRFGPAGEPPAGARARGTLAVLALLTMPAFLVQTYVVSPDIWLVLTTTVAGWALLEAERAEGRARLFWALALWAALGVSMLVKGPLALALVGGAAAVAALVRRDARILRPLWNPLGILLFAAISAPWYLIADARLPGLLDALVTRRLFGSLQATSEGVGHKAPLYVVWAPLIGTAPWLAALPSSIRALRARGAWRRGPGLVALCLALSAPLLFSLTPNRLPSYASPAFPWIAVLFALGAPAGEASPEAAAARRRELARATVGCAVVALALGVYVVATAPDFHVVAPWVALAAGAVGSALAAASLLRARGRDPTSRAAAAAVFLTLAMAAGAVLNPYRIPANKGLWEEVAARRAKGEELGMALPATGDWGLFPWYAREEVRYFDYPTNTVVRADAYRPDLFLPKERLSAWFEAKERRWLYLREKDRGALLGNAEAHVVARGGAAIVVTNLPLPSEPR